MRCGSSQNNAPASLYLAASARTEEKQSATQQQHGSDGLGHDGKVVGQHVVRHVISDNLPISHGRLKLRAAALGAFWLTSRIWYAIAYQNAPAKRGPAFDLSMTAFALAWCAGAWGIKRVLMS